MGELDDVNDLEAEFPLWDFGKRYQAAGSGPDGVTLIAWKDGVTLTSLTADGMRRKIREAGG